VATTMPIELRLMEKIELGTSGCWLWTGAINRHGYGNVGINGRTWSAHRAAYVAFVGPIPVGLQLDHLCRVRRCINPTHLEPVTSRENTLRGDTIAASEARRTRCPYGHEYTEENTRWCVIRRYANGREQWGRRCRACLREQDRARKRRRSGRVRVGN
jgi:hypothetical protein